MFATPLPAPLPISLASHLFGRFISPSGSEASDSSALASTGAVPSQLEGHDDDAMPDLAQRVREIGEW